MPTVLIAATDADKCSKGIQQRCVIIASTSALALGLACTRKQCLQFPTLVQAHENVAATHKLTIHINLWNGGPLRELLDALSEIWVGQNVSAAKVDAVCIQYLAGHVAEATHRRLRLSLHIQEDLVLGDVVLYLCVHAGTRFSMVLRPKVIMDLVLSWRLCAEWASR